ncbi:hypothetical protein Tco_0261640 [Tanacetum coccineum]
MGALPSNTIKNLKLNVNPIAPVLSARSYPTEDPQCSTRIHNSINAITVCPKQPTNPETITQKEENKEENMNMENINTNLSSPPDSSSLFVIEKVHKLNSFLESLTLVPQSSDKEYVCTKGDDGDVMFIEIIRKYNDSRKEGPGVDVNA